MRAQDVSAVRPLQVAGRVVLVAAAVAALGLSGGPLTPPSSLETWPAWAAEQDPIALVFAGIRMVALVIGSYVLAVCAIGVALSIARPAALRPFVRRVTVPAVRGLVQSVLGVTVVAATAMPPAALAHPAPSRAAGVAVYGAAEAQQPAPPGAPLQPRPTTHVHRQPTSATRRANPPDEPLPDRWRVRHGDHFWSIAQEHLRALDGRMPTDAATARYWRRLVQHNRHRLVDHRNPDLLLVGQVIDLPSVDRKR